MIQELEQQMSEWTKKCEELRQRVADRIAQKARSGFDTAIVDDIISEGGPRYADVEVFVENEDPVSLVIARGEDAVWVEFGAGVYHNGSVGSSPNPYGAGLGFTIGGYGIHGRQKIWGFYDGDGLKLTHGTPASMPMFHAVEDIAADLSEIAGEVFK